MADTTGNDACPGIRTRSWPVTRVSVGIVIGSGAVHSNTYLGCDGIGSGAAHSSVYQSGIGSGAIHSAVYGTGIGSGAIHSAV